MSLPFSIRRGGIGPEITIRRLRPGFEYHYLRLGTLWSVGYSTCRSISDVNIPNLA